MTHFQKEYLKNNDWSFITSTLTGLELFSRLGEEDELYKIEINSKTGEVSSYCVFDHEIIDIEEYESFDTFRYSEDI